MSEKKSFLAQNVTFLKGMGEKKSDLLEKELEITSYEDLLYYFPYKYIDRTQFHTISAIGDSTSMIQLRGHISSVRLAGDGYKQRLVAQFTDDTGKIELVWFKGVKFIAQSLKTDREYIVFGRPTKFGNKYNIAHPEVEEAKLAEEKKGGSYLQGYYNTSERMKKAYLNSQAIQKLVFSLLPQLSNNIPETFPKWFTEKYQLIPLEETIRQLHLPESTERLEKAQYRMKFEELFYIQLQIVRLQVRHKRLIRGHLFDRVGDKFNQFYQNNLPFELTGAQKKVVKEVRRDFAKGIQMNRLLQGDVGSGKTLVALLSMLIALDNGFQTMMMAPTEILALQHYLSITKFLEGIDIKVRLLTGSTKKAERKIIAEELEKGELDILIGTHALIEDSVQFRNVGLAIVDEQHRFGVAQRAKLWKKNDIPPHILVMTATPIPRTLAMTLYGDLDVSIIDELPPGRKAIKTLHAFDKKRLEVFNWLKQEIHDGRQIYIVFPLIKESEKIDLENLEAGYERVRAHFPEPNYHISMVHGQMKPAEKEAEMEKFKNGETQILVATTVIEVGVDVPNASVMLIENANRFGLSQLHQLRGRVGRGGNQSYCVLMTDYKLSNDSRTRLEAMVRTNDGFEIAEIDLKLRGPGDFEGTQQSGLPFSLRIANIAKDVDLLQYVREIATEIVTQDPELTLEENLPFRKQLHHLKARTTDWSLIS